MGYRILVREFLAWWGPGTPAAAHQVFYYGEDYHQQYLAKPGASGSKNSKNKDCAKTTIRKFRSCEVLSFRRYIMVYHIIWYIYILYMYILSKTSKTGSTWHVIPHPRVRNFSTALPRWSCIFQALDRTALHSHRRLEDVWHFPFFFFEKW